MNNIDPHLARWSGTNLWPLGHKRVFHIGYGEAEMAQLDPGFSPLTKYDDFEKIIALLDAWVARQGNGQYLSSEIAPPTATDLFPDFGIQQVRSEIADFAEVLLRRSSRRVALEIGLGFFGSTHFLWRLLFDKVFTIEKSIDRCRAFCRSYAKISDDHWCGTDGRSGFIYGFSTETQTVAKAYAAVNGPVDMLFIDGDHTYAGVLCDWLLYHGVVAPGGIVGFHDVATEIAAISEAPRLIRELESGQFGAQPKAINRIVHSKDVGIAYYIV